MSASDESALSGLIIQLGTPAKQGPGEVAEDCMPLVSTPEGEEGSRKGLWPAGPSAGSEGLLVAGAATAASVDPALVLEFYSMQAVGKAGRSLALGAEGQTADAAGGGSESAGGGNEVRKFTHAASQRLKGRVLYHCVTFSGPVTEEKEGGGGGGRLAKLYVARGHWHLRGQRHGTFSQELDSRSGTGDRVYLALNTRGQGRPES